MPLPHGCGWCRQPCLETRLPGDRVQQPTGAGRQGNAAAGVLGERQAVAGQRVPAQHTHGTRVVQAPVRERLELRPQHLVLLAVETKLLHPLGDREPIEPLQLGRFQQRVVRVGECRPHPLHEPVPALLGDHVALADAAASPLPVDVPGGAVGVARELDGEAGARDLAPGVRLVPVHPSAAVLDLLAVPRCRPGAPAEPVTGLEQQHVATGQRRFSRRCHTGKPASDHDHVPHRSLPPR